MPAPPSGTKSFAVVMEDPDAPTVFTHWLAYDLPATTRLLPEGASTSARRLDQAVEGTNSFGHIGYGGPCPPQGNAHHYVLHVYALDVALRLPPGQTREQWDAAAKGHVLAEAQITGLYARGGH
ncbi:hypothetical protein GCM10027066_19010 [Dyella jejuensis]